MKKPLFESQEMNTAIIFKEELNNAAIWNTIIMDLGLAPETDKITVKAISCSSEPKIKELSSRGKN